MSRAAFPVVIALAVLLAGCTSGRAGIPARAPGAPTSSSSAAPGSPSTAGMVTVDGLRLHLDCRGQGPPVVVLLAGSNDGSDVWDGLRPRLSSSMRTCAFDRPGVGPYSDPVSGRTTARYVASMLHATLRAAGLAPPYLLVGHSLAALSVIAYIGAYPREVSGVVLFDPTPPAYFEAHSAEYDIGWDNAATTAQMRAVPSWPVVPTEVLSSDPAFQRRSGMSAADEQEWQGDQQALARFARSLFLVVPDAGHYIFRDQPAAAVAAITNLTTQVSGRARWDGLRP